MMAFPPFDGWINGGRLVRLGGFGLGRTLRACAKSAIAVLLSLCEGKLRDLLFLRIAD
jgi:hypothetical protein